MHFFLGALRVNIWFAHSILNNNYNVTSSNTGHYGSLVCIIFLKKFAYIKANTIVSFIPDHKLCVIVFSSLKYIPWSSIMCEICLYIETKTICISKVIFFSKCNPL